jgi:ABC-type multidrug transport system fused ATPase/permease subunit
MITGERQAARIRSLYLQTILRQDVSFFDKETNTGEVVGRMSGDTVLIQDAMGEKVLMNHHKSHKSSSSFCFPMSTQKKEFSENLVFVIKDFILDIWSVTLVA